MKIIASFHHGKFFSKSILIILYCLIFILLITLFGLIVFIANKTFNIKEAIYGIVALIPIIAFLLWLTIRDLILKLRAKIWLQDSIRVNVFMEIINEPSFLGESPEVRAEIFWKESKNKKRRKVLVTVVYLRLYKNLINVTTGAYYSPKYERILFFKG